MRKLAALALTAAALAGCPSTVPTRTSIARVEIQGDPTSTSYVLHIIGNGFGPTTLSYDLSSAQGTAESDLHLEIFDSLERAHIPVPRTSLTIRDPRTIDAQVGTPLTPGSWGVRVFAGLGETPVVSAPDLFRIEDGTTYDGGAGGDAGPTIDTGLPAPDGGLPAPDGSTAPDATPSDGGGPTDSGLPPDAGSPPDSGLGAWVGAYQFRQEVALTNTTGALVPADTTVRIPIAHTELIGFGRAKPDGTDFAVYAGPTAVDYTWDDATKVGTNALVMIAKLPLDVPTTGPAALPLVLYYGDANATVAPRDAVLTYVQRFDGALGANWRLNAWNQCPYQRPTEGQVATDGTYCVADSSSTRVTLASPNLAVINQAIAANQAYEVSFWMAGRMISQANDLFYFSYGPDGTSYQLTTTPAPADYAEGPPDVASFNFTEITGGTRTVAGWRFGTALEWWRRTRIRIKPPLDATSLHFRYLSNDGATSPGSGVIVDDLQVRLVAQPELGVTLGAVEVR